ncbi:MAG TPA: EAL domain-containing protein [Ilumatobacter sp.]|nr:EAL domain-containing protein [Ilumatobacter sp.]
MPATTQRDTRAAAARDSVVTLVVLRSLLYVSAAVVALLLVDGGAPAAWICLVAAGLQPLLIPLSKRVWPRLAEAAFDTAVVVAIAFTVPRLGYTPLVLLVAGSTLLAATVRPELHLLIVALLIQGLLVLGASMEAFGWLTTVLVGGAVLAVAIRGSVEFRRNLQRTEAHLADAMSAARSIIQTIDVQTREVIDLAGDVREVTGWSRDEWLALAPADLYSADDLALFEAAIERLEHVPEFDFVASSRDPDGEPRWLRYTGRLEADERGRQLLRGMLADVTAIHKISDELYEQARRDRITGLPNRQRLEEDLDLHAVHAQPFVLLVADIRQFKAINDTLGHHIGDLILSMTGSRLSGLSEPHWSVYRLSSDQFALVVDGTNDADRAQVIAHQVTQECRHPHHVGRVALAAPVSVGVALSAANVAPSVTLRQADVALNAAKQANSQVELYHADMQRFTLENLVLSAAVEQGLDRGEFVLHFQPQIDLHTGEVVGAEGLVRWQHPERGLLAPIDFLETVRLSASFDRFTLDGVRQALLAAAAAQTATQAIGFAVNIELRSLLSTGFTDALLDLRSQHALGHHRLVLEVTETDLAEGVVAHSPIDLMGELERLRAGGYEVAIDDFGTGASSLFRLDRMPADELKIDKAFVQAVGTGRRSEMLLSSIIQLGRNLGLRVVAEGIEQPEQLTFLADAGCTVGQGWLFSKALPAAELLPALHYRHLSTAPAAGPEASTVTPLRTRRASN